jgi:enterochelin esterase family protein
MKRLILSLMAFTSLTVVAQNPTVPSVTENVVEDFKPASTNQENKQYPMVNSQRMVRAQITAPQATFVGLDIAGKIYAMTKDENGVWTGTSAPQDEGFHYYQLNIDGASVPDPGSKYYYGASRWGRGIDVPAADE